MNSVESDRRIRPYKRVQHQLLLGADSPLVPEQSTMFLVNRVSFFINLSAETTALPGMIGSAHAPAETVLGYHHSHSLQWAGHVIALNGHWENPVVSKLDS
jgi:hypothetical protein